MTHSLLGNTLNDINLSSKLSSKSGFNKSEAAVIAEKEIFKIKIDWKKSIEQNFDIEYCSKYMESFLQGEYTDFNLEESKLVESQQSILMEASYEPFEFEYE